MNSIGCDGNQCSAEVTKEECREGLQSAQHRMLLTPAFFDSRGIPSVRCVNTGFNATNYYFSSLMSFLDMSASQYEAAI